MSTAVLKDMVSGLFSLNSTIRPTALTPWVWESLLDLVDMKFCLLVMLGLDMTLRNGI